VKNANAIGSDNRAAAARPHFIFRLNKSVEKTEVR